MSASQFVGRVGGLAVALGVGVLFSGHGVAWADGPASDSGSASASRDAGPAARGPRASASRTSGSASVNRQGSAASVAQRTQSIAPAVSTVALASSGGGSNVPAAPADPSALALGLVEVARRPQAAAVASAPSAAATAAATASATAQQTFTNGSLTVAPDVTIIDGIIQGSLNATSERGATLKYSVVGSSAGAKLTLGTGAVDPTAQDFTALPYATWLDAGSQTPSGSQSVDVRVSEVTPFDQFITGIPLVGMLAGPVIDLLQRLPLISTLLAPIIGASLVASVGLDVNTLAAGKPVAFTYKVPSFDGTLISANWFPSVAVANGDAIAAPTVLSGPGLASPGQTNPYAEWGLTNQTLGVGTLREADLSNTQNTGYNVLTWDPRGEFASGGILQLDNPFFEGRDVSALISWVSNPALMGSYALCGGGQGSVTCDNQASDGNPFVGMVGGSYGGGIQLSAASIDNRIDAIVPDIAWNNLNESLYPSDIFRTAYGSLLLLSLITTGARINNQLYLGVLSGDLLGVLSQTAQAILGSSGPGGPDPAVPSLLSQLGAPTLLTQGTVDVLFPLQQSLNNAQAIANGLDPVTKAIWFCGGHGICADFTSDTPAGLAQANLLKDNALAWLDSYVNPNGDSSSSGPAGSLPVFQWVDQLGGMNSADQLADQSGFNNLANITATNAGGLLGILPFAIAGSGPGVGSLPYSAGNASQAATGINIDVVVPAGTQVVGAPKVTFTYSGLGTARAVYAQVIDKSTGRVLGNTVTPIPVTLDGQQRSVSFDIGNIAYTYGGTTNPGQLVVQITGSATAFWNSAWGAVNISNVSVVLPNRNPTQM